MLNIFMRVALVFCIALLVINVFSFVLFETTDTEVTFTELLTKLDQVKPIDLSLNDSMQLLKITDDWGVFNGFRDFINIFADLLGLIIWIGSVVVNLVYIIGYMLYLLGLQSFSAYV